MSKSTTPAGRFVEIMSGAKGQSTHTVYTAPDGVSYEVTGIEELDDFVVAVTGLSVDSTRKSNDGLSVTNEERTFIGNMSNFVLGFEYD